MSRGGGTCREGSGDLLAMGATLLAQLWPDGSLDSWRAGAVGGQVSLISHGRCFLDAEPPLSPSSSSSPLSPAETSSCLGCSGKGASPHVLLLCDPTPPTRQIHPALGSQPGLELKGDLTVSGGTSVLSTSTWTGLQQGGGRLLLPCPKSERRTTSSHTGELQIGYQEKCFHWKSGQHSG